MTTITQHNVTNETKLERLASSPLKRVLCVIHFAPVLRISDETGAGLGGFQDSVRSEYPSVHMDMGHEVELHADDKGVIGDPVIRKHPNWRLSDKTENWRVSLNRQSMSLEVGAGYSGRGELVDRFLSLVSVLSRAYEPIEFKRLGFRFFNLFEGDMLQKLNEYVRPEIVGQQGILGNFRLVRSLNQLQLDNGSLQFLVKHGFQQPGALSEMHPTPLEQSAWLLDIDGSRKLDESFNVDSIRTASAEITDAICHFFAWSVTTQFIEENRHA